MKTFLRMLKITFCLIIIAICSLFTIFIASELFVFMDIDDYEPGFLGYTVGSILISIIILIDVFYIYSLVGYFRKGKSYSVIYILSLALVFISSLSVVVLFMFRPALLPWNNYKHNHDKYAIQIMEYTADTYFGFTHDYELNGTVTINNSIVRIGNEISNGNNESLIYFEPEVFCKAINIRYGNDEKVEPLLDNKFIDKINQRYTKMMILKSSKYEGKKYRYDESKQYKFFYIVEPYANRENLKEKLYIVLIDGDKPLYDKKSKHIKNALKTIRFN